MIARDLHNLHTKTLNTFKRKTCLWFRISSQHGFDCFYYCSIRTEWAIYLWRLSTHTQAHKREYCWFLLSLSLFRSHQIECYSRKITASLCIINRVQLTPEYGQSKARFLDLRDDDEHFAAHFMIISFFKNNLIKYNACKHFLCNIKTNWTRIDTL